MMKTLKNMTKDYISLTEMKNGGLIFTLAKSLLRIIKNWAEVLRYTIVETYSLEDKRLALMHQATTSS